MNEICENTLHDRIANLCLNHLEKLPKTGKPTSDEWTVFSCIVAQNQDSFDVVASGTGSKCIGQDKMSSGGDILNDSHAEVICRRAFIRFIYEDMLSKSITKLTKFCIEQQKFVFNDANIKWHFFTTMMPCGDAAIFPKQDEEYFGHAVQPEEPMVKRMRFTEADINRTGAKCLKSDDKQDSHLKGVDYHVTGVVRTKPGRGVPTLSVSCSDKLAKWCHLGIQGALLSKLIACPIYLSTFTIAGNTLFNKDTLQRALFHRLGQVELTSGYHRHYVDIGQANVDFVFQKSGNKNPCPSSIIWFKNMDRGKPEIAVDGRKQGITKKQLKNAKASLKIHKSELFKCFTDVISAYKINLPENTARLTYNKAKSLAADYQESWKMLKTCFGSWTEKDNIITV